MEPDRRLAALEAALRLVLAELDAETLDRLRELRLALHEPGKLEALGIDPRLSLDLDDALLAAGL